MATPLSMIVTVSSESLIKIMSMEKGTAESSANFTMAALNQKMKGMSTSCGTSRMQEGQRKGQRSALARFIVSCWFLSCVICEQHHVGAYTPHERAWRSTIGRFEPEI